MSQNEQFRTELMYTMRNDGISPDMIKDVIASFDRISTGWSIDKACTDLSVWTCKWESFLKMYIASKAVEGLSNATLKSKMYVISNMFRDTHKDIDDITTADLRGWIYQKLSNKITDRTCEAYRITLNTFFAWCVNEGLIDRNPAEKINQIRFEAKQRQALSRMEVEIIRSVLKSPWEKAVVEIMLSTGCRVAELVGLRKSDIDGTTVHLFGKGKKHRDSFLNARAQLAIEEYFKTRNDDSEFVIVSRRNATQISTNAIERFCKCLKTRVQDRITKDLTPHVFRHTFATLMLQAGGSMKAIQTIMGHESMDTTSIYAEVNSESIRAEHLRYVS